MRTLSLDTGFNTLARTPGDSANEVEMSELPRQMVEEVMGGLREMSLLEWIYYIRPENPLADDFAWKGQANTLLPKQ